MNAPSERDVKRLFALSLNQCAFPDCVTPIFGLKDELFGEICHIKGKSKGGPRFDPTQPATERHSFNNLILLCRNHHKAVDDNPERYTAEWLVQLKRQHEQNGTMEITPEDARLARKLLDSYTTQINTGVNTGVQQVANGHNITQNGGPTKIKKQSINVTNSDNTGIIANVVNLKGAKTPKMNYPADAIGADTIKKSYIDYLYGRYIDFRKADTSFGAFSHSRNFHPGELHRTIASKFKAKTFFVHVNRFTELVNYMQQRIDSTILGRRNSAKGIPSYQNFDEFQREQLG